SFNFYTSSEFWSYDRLDNLKGLVTAVWTQASGSPSGLHGLLMNYQVPALTLTTVSPGDSSKNYQYDQMVADGGRHLIVMTK
ncbi:unnamed protein product, partial [Protopolystoma xenopodis]